MRFGGRKKEGLVDCMERLGEGEEIMEQMFIWNV